MKHYAYFKYFSKFQKLMNDTFSHAQEWLTVFFYVGFTVFIIWCVLVSQNK